MYTISSIDLIRNTWDNIRRSSNGLFAYSHEVEEAVEALERLKMKTSRDTANLSKQVSGVRNEVYEVNSRVGRVNEKVDHVDSDVKMLKLRQEAMEQLLAKMASTCSQKTTKFYGGVHTHIHDGADANPQKAMEFHGGEHIHIYDGAVANQHTRRFVTKLKSARHSRSERFKSQEDSDSDSDDDGYLSHA